MLFGPVDQKSPEHTSRSRPLSERLRRFFIPPRVLGQHTSDGAELRWLQVREQILTGILRVAAILSIPAFAVSLQPVIALGLWPLALFYTLCIGFVTMLGLWRQLRYWVRANGFLLILYILAVSELASFGYTEDAYGYLVVFALMSLILFGGRAGVGALLASVATLGVFGLGQSLELGLPLSFAVRPLTPEMAIATSALFLTNVGIIQAALIVLLHSIDTAWLESQQARNQLEQRVAERTQELVAARDQALALSNYRSEQNQFLSTLYETTLELLQHQDRELMLQRIVDRACAILDAPYGQLLLIDGDQLVVHTYTDNVAPQAGLRLGRDDAQLAWQAIDTRSPAVIESYASWEARHRRYDQLVLQATANFPIMKGERSLGVLALARSTPGYTYSSDELQKGQLFSQLVAVVIDNADLYSTALGEIAERRAAEAALKAQNAELDAFAHTVAHDLKAPLTYLIGNAELLQLIPDLRSPPHLDAQLAEMLAVSQKMNTIVDALLMLSSVRSRVQVQTAILDMQAIVIESLRRLQPQIRESGAEVTLPEAWPAAMGYAPWVEEIWVNYLSNALKYGGRPPQVQLGAEELDGFIRFWVQDNGQGLAPEQQARLFTPFTRLQDANIHGHGLGLSITQRIASQLGGEVGVESDTHGSRFFFTLPRAVDQ